ncbi:hypothetical protein AMAG_05572 [Allomyces macrogynus ATCC 38327]|uniref:TBP-associated factor 12 n=1 Tax=Allomyces macrogynus (strain ATCC 38327) TaxID=578462 RepID=A0A0L0SCN4_ALLM3|nr:hypothetical protein AMAG_05572 [Allomyces macrogynus ATCC 38327]|eukprot:KNE60150.1 hypothetical protein AMAG_05572 [Allomyces macrogynus ATCC 38327]
MTGSSAPSAPATAAAAAPPPAAKRAALQQQYDKLQAVFLRLESDLANFPPNATTDSSGQTRANIETQLERVRSTLARLSTTAMTATPAAQQAAPATAPAVSAPMPDPTAAAMAAMSAAALSTPTPAPAPAVAAPTPVAAPALMPASKKSAAPNRAAAQAAARAGNAKTHALATLTPSTSTTSRAALPPKDPVPPTTTTAADATSVVTKRKLTELIAQIDPHQRVDPDVHDMLMELADEFIESVTTFGAQLARHRRGNTLEVRDLQLYLETHYQMRIPGFFATTGESLDIAVARRKPVAVHAHQARVAAVKKAIFDETNRREKSREKIKEKDVAGS